MRRFSPRAASLKEAADWLARLRADDRSPEDERAFRAWLTADPANGVAFDAVNATWDAAGALPRDLRDGRVLLESGVSRRRLLLGGAGLAVAGGGTFFFLQSAAAEVYQTDVGEQKHVTLKDGTDVFLDTLTKLVVDFSARDRSVDLRYGRANFLVAPDPKRVFAVKAARELVVGRHASVDVRRDGEDVSVLLIRGQATVECPGARSGRVLSEGERLVFTAQGAPILDKPNLLPLLAWHTGQAIFESSTLPEAIAEMNRYSNIKLEIGDPRLAKMKVSGVYRVGDNASFARSLTRLLPISLSFGNDRIELTGDNARLVEG